MFYSTKEVSDILKISEATVLRLVREGEIRAVKLGKRLYRVHASSLESLKDVGLLPRKANDEG
ncbi:helix-turn-helix domain-containing protein [Deinococcus alpinitundrae]|uniref:helix-turn-helix domain-containing protein n=1 Tax=Deinococcus alpinitundrae TaxID=468913 RepID=UPI001379E5E9